jgi:[ribosomal protein S5]-alanine N-acetyltransferase
MIQTKRLLVTPWSKFDAQAFLELSQDSGFNQYLITQYRQNDLVSAQEWIRQNPHKLAVREKQGTLVGMGGLTPWTYEGEEMVDITYRLKGAAHGRGLGTELAHALFKFGFYTLGLQEITATITADNLVSKKILDHLGFVFDKKIVLLGVVTDLYRCKRVTN